MSEENDDREAFRRLFDIAVKDPPFPDKSPEFNLAIMMDIKENMKGFKETRISRASDIGKPERECTAAKTFEIGDMENSDGFIIERKEMPDLIGLGLGNLFDEDPEVTELMKGFDETFEDDEDD